MKLKLVLNYFQEKPWHWWLAIIITLLAGVLRFYRIPDNVMFLGDQGRDAIIVSRIFKEINPVFIGPVTSVGNMYLGPFYYYFMLPFLWLSYPSPLGPVYAVAFFSTLTVFLMYVLGKKMFSPVIGLLASFFLAFSAEAIYLSRFSWNPNLAPLFSLLMIYFSWKAFVQSKYWILVTLMFSLIIQLHYLTLLSGAALGLIWLYDLWQKLKTKNQAAKKSIISRTAKICLVCILVLLLSLVPQILFDLKHKGLNLNAFKNMFVKEEVFSDRKAQNFSQAVNNFFRIAQGRANQILIRIPLDRVEPYETLLLTLLILALIFQLYRAQQAKNSSALQSRLIIFIFLITGILGTALYRESIYTHYIAYLFPIFAFSYALVVGSLLKLKNKIMILPVVLILAGFVKLNLPRWPLEANGLYHRTQQTSQVVYQHLLPNEAYEIVLLSESKDLYGQSYRYFLTTTDNPPVIRERGEIPETLVIIDEEKKDVDVTQLPIYEIVIFPEKTVDQYIQTPNLPDIYILRVQDLNGEIEAEEITL